MRKAVLVIVSLVFALTSEAQFNQDYGIMLGVGTHYGDINKSTGNAPFGASKAALNFGAYYRYKFSSLISARGQFSWGRISGDDANADDPSRIARNLSFRTDLYEFAGIVEIHALDIKDFGRTGRYNIFFNLYGFTGIAMTYFDPKAKTDAGEWVKLRPLQTEGVNYSSITPAIPLGIGAHFTFDRKWRLGAELGYRFAFTDYLDDVSGNYMTNAELAEITDEVRLEMQNRSDQEYIENNPAFFGDGYEMGNGGIRGGPDVNDAYFYGTVNVGLLIRGKSNFYRSKYNFTRGRSSKKRRARAKF